MRLQWFKRIFFEVPFVIFLTVFLLLTILVFPQNPNNNLNPLFDYYTQQLPYLKWYGLLFGFFVVLFIITHPKKFGRAAFRYAFGLCLIVLLALHVSLFVTFLFGLGDIEYHLLTLNTKQEILTDPEAIGNAIIATDHMEQTTIAKNSYKKELFLFVMHDRHSFFNDRILPSFPTTIFTNLPVDYPSMAFVNHHFVMTAINNHDLSIISPALGKFLVENGFNAVTKKQLPPVTVLDKNEYLAFRKQTIESQIKKIDTVLGKVDGSIQNINDAIAQNQQVIADQHKRHAAVASQFASLRCATTSDCQMIQNAWNKYIAKANDTIDTAALTLEKNQAVLGASIDNKNTLAQSKQQAGITEAFADQELGVFIPQKGITIMVDSQDPAAYDKFISTLAHEYLHYLSYKSTGQTLDHFFEEGLTEYFARKAAKEYLHSNIAIGYPMETNVIQQMTTRISENQLLEIYFSKDQEALQQLLDNTYGDNFYETHAKDLNTLIYLPPLQAKAVTDSVLREMNK
jgi:hypothetical protein